MFTDEEEKARRQKVMAEVNKAYEECDEERIKQILDVGICQKTL